MTTTQLVEIARPRRMPRQKPGKSKQDVETPPEFIEAVTRRFGMPHVDLACSALNRKAAVYYTKEDDALSKVWAFDGGDHLIRWLNPEFGQITKWARKCAEEGAKLRIGRILLLTPASVSSEWFRRHVHDQARVLPLSPRIKFVGHEHAFPKDMMLSVFGGGLRGFQPWRWTGKGCVL